MSIAVLWIEVSGSWSANAKLFKSSELGEALKFAEVQRKAGMNHVTISSELEDLVGKPGVSSIEDGKTPDGHDYEWSKQHRGAGPRKD